MNRLVIIGNGFDLAHGFPTSYVHFMKHFWEEKIKHIKSFSNQPKYIDPEEVIHLQPVPNVWNDDNTYTSFKECLKNFKGSYAITNNFINRITNKYIENWVDIENEYFELLKEYSIDKNLPVGVSNLNKEFALIRKWLIEYLKNIELNKIDKYKNPSLAEIIGDKIYSPVLLRDCSEVYIDEILSAYLNSPEYNSTTGSKLSAVELRRKLLSNYGSIIDLKIDNLLFLNFNYTSTSLKYVDSKIFTSQPINIQHIHIHGNLFDSKNPIIFGYGDELHSSYSKIEELNNNECLVNSKSVGYQNQLNYKRLLQFINGDKFQIFIMGHSCGNSDRTLLNTIFEHNNCISIKPFYYCKNDVDNYSELVINISRNFRDKSSMRDKLVNKEFCTELSK